MSGTESPRSRLSEIVTVVSRVGSAIGTVIEQRAEQIAAFERRALHRAVSLLALLLVAAVFACAAAGFAAAAVLAALGEAHLVLGAALIAAGFAVLCASAVALARRLSGPAASREATRD